MNRIIAAHSLNKRPITVEEASLIDPRLISEEQNRQIMIEDVLRTISGHFNVTKTDILSSRRHKTIVYPRQIGMYLAKVLTTRFFLRLEENLEAEITPLYCTPSEKLKN